MTDNNSRDAQNFLKYVLRIRFVELVGVAHILCVPITDDKGKTRTPELIISEMYERFLTLGREKRRELLKILKSCPKRKDKKESDE